ncbi:MAG: allantoate amidohydrolase [Sphingobium sp.]|jgi:allantoate deiminase|uniref:Zn-dependent hydrolase n=1 Tax=Sphingobium xenophagum TaxID=121428 RepID=A0A249MYQ3_SPHXE|nr:MULTISPECIES: allantoate amidohydrolase [Sphingobium]MBU0658931.1 allantoate amidohydrolase [Alphaproteobacteria bacterium]ASY46249.1 Zn-dependent hydrolase [Sphingobium xenophagum]MBA4756188.1 allantoate amidohydrolase [Sphingobium sp.]MBS89461.1 allantoate amidohydrolase [Sphingobium sp.]MBU0867554.1 allantoate amidohydrolase [Alphaproteobacteria bacterium]|tara:strand:+ start:793 stop:2028 length:1236 start_codon:yes stop_codon:yes gene_type:complete
MVSGGARAVARCDALGVAPYSDMAHGLYRGYLTKAYAAAQEALAGWMAQAGMAVRRDAAANLIGRYEGTLPGAPTLLIGSHLDSVRDGGRYDGPLGIMLGVEAVATLQQNGQRPPFPIEVIAFGDEEGSRFPAAMLTSRAVAGTLALDALDLVDADGVALAHAGVNLSNYLSAARAPGSTLAYLEAHIEQGPVLEAEGLAVGTVTGIAAQLRYQAIVRGMAGHAGTSSMPLRRDALAGAAEMILAIEGIARADASDLVATVGRIEAMPGAPNVIAGEVRFTIDIRSGDAARRDRAAEAICDALAGIADRRDLDFAIQRVHDLPASPCNVALMDLMDAAIAAVGHPVRRLVSGAGHDAMVMAALCPTAMLFIRCRHGISHNPAEHVDPADVDVALQVMLGFIDRLGATFDPA